jgi:IS1 family transposase
VRKVGSLPAVYRHMYGALHRFLANLCGPDIVLFAKEGGKTSLIERLNNTLQQRLSRLVTSILSSSKTVENHIGAIGILFIAITRAGFV